MFGLVFFCCALLARRTARSFPHRGHREQRGDVLAAVAAVAQAQQAEQGASGHALPQGGRSGSVRGDAGCSAVLVEHRRAIRDRHPVQRHPGLESLHHLAHDDPGLVVGVGTAEDPVPAGRIGRGGVGRTEHGCEPVREVGDRDVGVGVAAGREDRRREAAPAEGEQQRHRTRTEGTGREGHDRAEVVQRGGSLVDHRGGGPELILLGVGARDECPDRPDDLDHRGGARPGGADPGERGVVEGVELGDGGGERPGGGGVAREVAERSADLVQRGPDRAGPPGGGERHPSRRGQERGAEELRDPVDRLEAHVDEAAGAAAGLATEGQAGVGGRHGDGHGRERVTGPERGDALPERRAGRRAVGPHHEAGGGGARRTHERRLSTGCDGERPGAVAGTRRALQPFSVADMPSWGSP